VTTHDLQDGGEHDPPDRMRSSSFSMCAASSTFVALNRTQTTARVKPAERSGLMRKRYWPQIEQHFNRLGVSVPIAR